MLNTRQKARNNLIAAVRLIDKYFALKYDPDQPRDEAGRWTDGGGSSEGAGGEDDNNEVVYGNASQRIAMGLQEINPKLSEPIEKLSKDEKDAVHSYSVGSYRELNDSLREGYPRTEAQETMRINIENAIDKAGIMDHDEVVLRGVRVWDSDKTINEFESRIGETIRMPGFQSCSFINEPVMDASHSTAKGIVFEVTTNQGLYIADIASYDDEYEFLLGNNWQYQITGVVRDAVFVAGRDYNDHIRNVVKLKVIGK